VSSSKYSRRADSAHDKISSERLSVSFEFLDLSLPEFFIHGLDEEHYRKFFDCLNALANATKAQIVQQTHPSLIPKSIFNKGGTYPSFPAILIDLIALKIRAPKSAPDPDDIEAIKIAEAELRDSKSQASEVIRRLSKLGCPEVLEDFMVLCGTKCFTLSGLTRRITYTLIIRAYVFTNIMRQLKVLVRMKSGAFLILINPWSKNVTS